MYVYVSVCIYVCMCVCVCVYVYSEILVLKKKEFCDNMNEPWHYAKLKKQKKHQSRKDKPCMIPLILEI